MRSDRLITFKGFLNAFLKQHRERPDRPFCFVLGAGASRPSGIPAGVELARCWLEEMHVAEDFEGLPLEQWATADRLAIPDFDINRIGYFYPQLYSRRFKNRDQEGYAFLENQMDGKEPSFGYSVLAYLLSETRHKITITTNFDNLVADALSIHSNTFPIVVHHDSLAAYARVELRRPLIAKIHGGLGFQPKNSPEDVSNLPEGWKTSLHHILSRYTPIIIGYDGNDGSLMGFLEELPCGIPDTVYWCFRSKGSQPEEHLKAVSDRVREFVSKKNGWLVPILGFDELMAILLPRLKEMEDVPDLFERLKERARKREHDYEEQQRLLYEHAVGRPPSVQQREDDGPVEAKNIELGQAVAKLAGQRKEKPWWLWVQEADAQTDPDKKEAVYQMAIEAMPTNPSLLGNYAVFLYNTRKDANRAEEYYRRAIEDNPNEATNLGNYAVLLSEIRKDADRAEEYYKRAIVANPKHANNLGNYAVFLNDVRKDADRAEEYYKRAIEADPKHTNHLGNYARFLRTIRKDADRAEEYYKRAIEANPNNAMNLTSYAVFLNAIRKDADRAEEYYKRAIEANPNGGNSLGNYAQLLFIQGRDAEASVKLSEAEAAGTTPNALRIELTFYRLAHLPEAWPSKLAEMKSLLVEGARSPGWDLSGNVQRASQSGHLNIRLLEAIAHVISDDAPLASLDEFPEWRQATLAKPQTP
jgi:protein O-mannosyl-transferase